MTTTACTIAKGTFTQGELTFPVNCTDLAVAIGEVNKLSASLKAKFARLNGIPCEPFSAPLIQKPLLGCFQNLWKQAIEGSVSQKFVDAQATRMAIYTQQLEQFKNAADDDLVGGTTKKKAKTTGEGGEKVLQAYTMNPAFEADWTKAKGQQYLIRKAIQLIEEKQGKQGANIRQIMANVFETPETECPGTTNVQSRLMGWKKLEWVLIANADQIKSKPATTVTTNGKTTTPTDKPKPAVKTTKK